METHFCYLLHDFQMTGSILVYTCIIKHMFRLIEQNQISFSSSFCPHKQHNITKKFKKTRAVYNTKVTRCTRIASKISNVLKP